MESPPKAPRPAKAFVQPADFQPLLKHSWAGTYTSKLPNPSERPLRMVAAVDSSNVLDWVFYFSFGPDADSSMLPIHIARNGKKINSAKVISRSKSKIGTLQLVTLAKINGTSHRETYFLNFDTFGIQHEEKGPEEAEFRIHHTYILHRE